MCSTYRFRAIRKIRGVLPQPKNYFRRSSFQTRLLSTPKSLSVFPSLKSSFVNLDSYRAHLNSYSAMWDSLIITIARLFSSRLPEELNLLVINRDSTLCTYIILDLHSSHLSSERMLNIINDFHRVYPQF